MTRAGSPEDMMIEKKTMFYMTKTKNFNCF